MDETTKQGNGVWGKVLGVLVLLGVLWIVAVAVESGLDTSGPVANRPAPAAAVSQPQPVGQTSRVFTGVGNQATELFELNKGLARFAISNHADGYFGIWLMDAGGRKVALLANDAPYSSGSKAVGIERAGQYLCNVESEGAWQISVR